MSCIISGVGRIGAEPEFKVINGIDLANISIAVSAPKDITFWIRGTIWDYKISSLSKVLGYLTKGKQIHFSGSITNVRVYKRNNGELGSSTEATIHSINFVNSNRNELEELKPDQASIKEHCEF